MTHLNIPLYILIVPRRFFFCGSVVFFCVLRLSCFRVLFIAALWPPVGIGFVGDVYYIFVTFPYCILGMVWYLIVSLPDVGRLSYFSF